MSYSFEKERPWLFTEDAQKQFLSVRDEIQRLFKVAGCCTIEMALRNQSGDSWKHLAIIDRLAEICEIKIVDQGDLTQWRLLIPYRRP